MDELLKVKAAPSGGEMAVLQAAVKVLRRSTVIDIIQYSPVSLCSQSSDKGV